MRYSRARARARAHTHTHTPAAEHPKEHEEIVDVDETRVQNLWITLQHHKILFERQVQNGKAWRPSRANEFAIVPHVAAELIALLEARPEIQ